MPSVLDRIRSLSSAKQTEQANSADSIALAVATEAISLDEAEQQLGQLGLTLSDIGDRCACIEERREVIAEIEQHRANLVKAEAAQKRIEELKEDLRQLSDRVSAEIGRLEPMTKRAWYDKQHAGRLESKLLQTAPAWLQEAIGDVTRRSRELGRMLTQLTERRTELRDRLVAEEGNAERAESALASKSKPRAGDYEARCSAEDAESKLESARKAVASLQAALKESDKQKAAIEQEQRDLDSDRAKLAAKAQELWAVAE